MDTALSMEPRRQTGRGPSDAPETIFKQELILAIRDHWALLLCGPIVVAAIAYLIASIIPGRYTSDAYVRMDRAAARSMEALMVSPNIAHKVLSKYSETGNGPEGHVRFLTRNLSVSDIEPLGDRQAVRLFRIEVTHRDPKIAQSISSDLIAAWHETTKPGPVERVNLEAEIQRNKTSAALNTALIDQLHKEAVQLLAPNSMAGEIATPISILVAKRDQTLAATSVLETRLLGAPADVIVATPHLPIEARWPRKGAITILAAVTSLPLSLVIILIARLFAPGTSISGVWMRLRRSPT